MPGAVAAGATGRFGRGAILPDGKAPADRADEIMANRFATTPGYLPTMGLKLRSGRFFSESDTETSQPVAIVNESLAKRAWPGIDPLGRTIRWGKDDKLTRTVVGVVSDARGNPLEPVRPEIYLVHTQQAAAAMQLLVRTTGNPAGVAKLARAEVAAVDPHQAVSNVRTMEDLLAFQIAPQRVTSGLLTVFAAVALLLAATGIYGVMAYSVSQRSHEFGVRVALGASRQHIARMVVREAGMLGVTGAAIGVLAAFGLTRLMKAVLFGVSATDPLTFVSVPTVLTLTAIAAAYVPTLRATQVDPVKALRCD
jgi:putative ABC transport system permease protein